MFVGCLCLCATLSLSVCWNLFVSVLLIHAHVVNFASPDVVGLIHFFGVIPAGLLTKWLWDERRKPGVRWFLVATIAAAVWSVSSGAIAVLDSTAGTLLFHNIRFFVVVVAAASWFLLALEYTYKESVPTRWFYYLLVVPVITQILSVVEPTLVFTRTVDSQGILDYTYGPWFIFDQLIYGFGLVFVGSSFWIGDALMSRDNRRRQTSILLLATLLLLCTSLLLAIGWPSDLFDVSVLGIIAAESLIGVAFKRYSLLQISPVARDAVVREMNDAAFILDPNDVVTDLNPAARQLLDHSVVATGENIQRVFSSHEQLLEQLKDTYSLETTVTLSLQGTERHFTLRVSPVTYGRGLEGRFVVLRDITELKEREEELDVLKQVFARVFRHNARNKLSPIRTYAELIQRKTDGQVSQHAARIEVAAKRLSSQSEKVGEIERATGVEETTDLDLAKTVEDAVRTFHATYPDLDITTSVGECVVRANPRLQVAIEELLDNAIRHNDLDSLAVDIAAEQRAESVVLSVTDTGNGIPQNELDVLRSAEETQLEHSSGVGLWLVRSVVRQSDGSLSFESTNDGTTVTLELPTTDRENYALE